MTLHPVSRAAATRSPVVVLALIAVAQFVIVLDVSITNMALPALAADLRLGPRTLSWVTNGYLLTFGGLLLLGGRISDLLGARVTYSVGCVLFGFGSLACAAAADELQLVAARAGQGIGSALLAPAALALVAGCFEERERERAVAVWAAAGAAAAPAGAILGGLLVAVGGWQLVFLVNVPLCVASAAVAVRALPSAPRSPRGSRADAAGALTGTAAIALLLLAVVEARSSPRLALAAVAAAFVTGLQFARAERGTRTPLLPPRLVRSTTLRAATVVTLLGQMAQHGVFLFLTLFLQGPQGLTSLEAGVAFVPFGVCAVAAARFAPALIAACGPRAAAVVAALALAVGGGSLIPLEVGEPYPVALLPAMVLMGAGGGLLAVAAGVVGLARVQSGDEGVTGAVLTTAQQLGAALGVAVAVVVYGGATNGLVDVGAMGAVFVAATLLSLLTALAAKRFPSRLTDGTSSD